MKKTFFQAFILIALDYSKIFRKIFNALQYTVQETLPQVNKNEYDKLIESFKKTLLIWSKVN